VLEDTMIELDEYQKERNAYAEGYNDAYQNGEYLNPYDGLTQEALYVAYDNGHEDGMDKLVTEAV